MLNPLAAEHQPHFHNQLPIVFPAGRFSPCVTSSPSGHDTTSLFGSLQHTTWHQGHRLRHGTRVTGFDMTPLSQALTWHHCHRLRHDTIVTGSTWHHYHRLQNDTGVTGCDMAPLSQASTWHHYHRLHHGTRVTGCDKTSGSQTAT